MCRCVDSYGLNPLKYTKRGENLNNKIVGCILGATVGIILISSMLMPILNDAAVGETDRFVNNSTYVEYYTDDAVLTITSEGVSIDGVALTPASGNYFVSDNISAISAGNTVYLYYAGITSMITVNTAYTITITDGVATINNGTDDIATLDCPGLYIHSSTETDNVSSLQGTERYINGISDIRRCQIVNDVFYSLIDGKLYANGVETAFTISSGINAVEGYDNLYKTTGALVLDLTDSDTSITLNFGYVLPHSIVGVVSDTAPSAGIVALYFSIPAILIIAIFAVIVRVYARD